MAVVDTEEAKLDSGTEAGGTEASGIECRGQPGKVAPLVDFNRCEAQADCERVCPFDVFEIRPIEDHDRANLSLRGKIKTWVHGANKAYTPNADNCHACKLCVDACPENAITLVRVGG